MSRGVFRTPVPWGVGPGPTRLYSIGGAVGAVDLWLQVTPDFPQLHQERERMLALRDLLAALSEHMTEGGLEAAELAIRRMVGYSNSREAGDARIASYVAHRAA